MTKPVRLLGVNISPVGIEEAQEQIIMSLSRMDGDFFCFSDLHLLMACYADHEVRRAVGESKGNFADGMAVAWGLKILGSRFKYRVRGTDLMLRLCSYAAKHDLRIFLYGNTDENLGRLKEILEALFPKIHFVGAISPPFRELSIKEAETIVAQINKAKPDILFVSLGAPKQEKWMAAHKGKVEAVQLGVGAAFDLITGSVKQAPVWMQKAGLEWLFRMPQQPKKTGTRMLLLPKFAFLVLRDLIRNGRKGS
jgi:N-acetylglucosaminyldiphosphoundecaprenol N-acetyl-beta-D-mannosaminyltransferase